MGIFNKQKEPIFLKESSNIEEQIIRLKELEPKLNKEGQSILRQDIKCLEYGLAGENDIAFELKNSHFPMYILHDIYLESGDLSAQIDYLVFTRKLCFVIECKNLFGNIEINNRGDFIRTIDYGGRKIKEGIYSPITQNQRHMELLKKIKVDNKNNIITKFMAEKFFENFHIPVVVLANNKTVLNAKFAKKEIKEKVIRADQLINYIKEVHRNSKESEDSDENMKQRALRHLELHKEIEKDYTKKYESFRIDNISGDGQRERTKDFEDKQVQSKNESISEISIGKDEEQTDVDELIKKLKAFRLQKSREEQIKPYYIFNDNQLRDLISKMPRNKAELLKVDGFGEVKVGKYGDEILKMLAIL